MFLLLQIKPQLIPPLSYPTPWGYNIGDISRIPVITDGTFNITSVKTGLSCKDAIKIKDGIFNISSSYGKVLVSYTTEKAYQSVIISTAEMSVGSTYTLTAGSQSFQIEQTAIVTSNGNTGGGYWRTWWNKT